VSRLLDICEAAAENFLAVVGEDGDYRWFLADELAWGHDEVDWKRADKHIATFDPTLTAALVRLAEADDPEPEFSYYGGMRDGEETNEHEAWQVRQDFRDAVTAIIDERGLERAE
jgi:hypothetical protein